MKAWAFRRSRAAASLKRSNSLQRERSDSTGAGLGLAICRGLIEAHGGRIWVDDHNGPGTTLSFTLPLDSTN